MKISNICIRHPVLAIVLSLLIVVVGIIGYQQLEVRFFPELIVPEVTISTSYTGASAESMENDVTTLLENSLAGIHNVDYMSSSSSVGSSSITLRFLPGTDLEAGAAQVRDKVASQKQYLPADALMPVVSVGVNAQAVIAVGFTDDHKTQGEIREYLHTSLEPVLRQLPGVGGLLIQGANDYAMRVWLNAAKMVARNITVTDITTAITSNNITFPAGSLYSPSRSYSVLSDTFLNNADAFANIIVKQTGQGPVRLGQVANVELGHTGLNDPPMRISGHNGVLLQVDPMSGYSPIKVAQEVRAVVAKAIPKLPPGMHAQITYDDSHFLQSSINEAFISIGEAVVLVILVILIFLGSFRAALIPIVTIPVSLVGVFLIIKLLGFSINIMSLLGMVLAIGLVVDDAIVMLENIHRHIEEGMSPMEAAFKGSKEIGFAVIVMALTLVAVYAPVGLMKGVTSTLFIEFAFTLAGAVIISAFVALTLSPMMCSRILQPSGKEGGWIRFVDRVFEGLTKGYQALLLLALRLRYVVIIILLVIAVAGYFLFQHMPSEMIPKEDTGRLTIALNSPVGATLQYTDQNAKLIEKILAKVPAIKNFTTAVNTTSSTIHVELQPWGKRDVTSQQVEIEINKKMAQVPGITAVAFMQDAVDFGGLGGDINLNFTTAGNYKDLLGPIDKMESELKKYPGIQSVDTGLKFDSQQYAISINRDLASAIGVGIQDIADTVHTMMGSFHVSDVHSGGRSFEVLLQMQLKDLLSFNALNRIYVNASPIDLSDVTGSSVTNSIDNMIPLSSLITLTPQIGQGTLYHFNRSRSGNVTGTVAPGYTESQVIAKIDSLSPGVLNSNVNAIFSGKAAQFLQSSGNMAGVFVMSFAFIYLMLAAQFGSFIDPFIILLAVPLSMVGALFSLMVGGGTLNLYSEIGLVTLVGLISKHGILITQFINNLRKEGVPIKQAIVDGAGIRFRPIMMTTAAMIFGALPLALASGPGSIGRHDIGWTIVGGLLFGTFFSLIVVPVAYSFLGRLKKVKTSSN